MKRNMFGWLVAAALVGAPLSGAKAAGLLVADGGFGGALQLEEHSARVTINNGIAVTEVTQLFRNLENRQVEALYTFPVPAGASVSNFSMWINGKEMVGEVLEKEKARQIYSSYKQVRQDPGLLEQTDYRTFEMRIFPIGPRAQQKVQVTYYQELDFDHDAATYVYPLATTTKPGADSRVKGKFALSLEAKSEVPIVEMASPSHAKEFVIVRHDDGYWQASLETTGGDLSRDLVLTYDTARPRTGMDLVASKDKSQDGFFYMTLTVGEDLEALERGMDYVFVLDISGSMANDGKLRTSRDSIAAFVRELDGEDRFEVMAFNLQPKPLFRGLVLADDAHKAQAEAFLMSQEARGGTVLSPALTTAYGYADVDRFLNVVILSDGLTEQSDRPELARLIRSRPAGARVFTIGVGNDINRPLLEQMAHDAGGLCATLSAGDDFGRAAKSFRRKLMRPAAANVRIDFAGSDVYDVEPKLLPNLYHGAPLRLYGRYREGGPVKVTLTGDVNGRALTKTAQLDFPKEDASNPEIERMWAWRRVDRLLKEADSQGSRQSVVPEVVALGEAFSIVTEHTSFLVLENDAEFQRWRIERRNLARVGRDRKAQEALRADLDRIRAKAIEGLGPQPAQAQPAAAAPQTQAPGANSMPAGQPTVSRGPNRSRGFDWNVGGGGAFDPATGALALVLTGLAAAGRRKNRKEN